MTTTTIKHIKITAQPQPRCAHRNQWRRKKKKAEKSTSKHKHIAHSWTPLKELGEVTFKLFFSTTNLPTQNPHSINHTHTKSPSFFPISLIQKLKIRTTQIKKNYLLHFSSKTQQIYNLDCNKYNLKKQKSILIT